MSKLDAHSYDEVSQPAVATELTNFFGARFTSFSLHPDASLEEVVGSFDGEADLVVRLEQAFGK